MVARTGKIRNPMDESLQGKVVIVTGAARRVGAAIARRLHGAGMQVVLHYRNSASDARALERALNGVRAGSAICVRAELLEADAPDALIGAALEHYARLDLLVNNASTFYPTRFGEIDARRGIGLGQAEAVRMHRAGWWPGPVKSAIQWMNPCRAKW